MAAHYCLGNECPICNPSKQPLGSFTNPVAATVTINPGYVGNYFGANFYVSPQKAKRAYNKINGKQFKQHKPFMKKFGPRRSLKRTIFYHDIVTVIRRIPPQTSGNYPRRQAIYSVSMNGSVQIAGGVTYSQLRKCFTPV